MVSLLLPSPPSRHHGAAPLQLALSTSQPGDAYEREADDVAQQVMRAPGHVAPPTCSCGGSGLDGAACDECSEKPEGGQATIQREPAPESSHEVDDARSIGDGLLRSTGRPLDPQTRAFMEERFDRDFAAVRVHADAAAAESAGPWVRGLTPSAPTCLAPGTTHPAAPPGGCSRPTS